MQITGSSPPKRIYSLGGFIGAQERKARRKEKRREREERRD
jgi:hypothetical protein